MICGRPEEPSASQMCFGQIGIERQRLFYGVEGFFLPLLLFRCEQEGSHRTCQAEIGLCQGTSWVNRNGAFQRGYGGFVVCFVLATIRMKLAAQVKVESLGVDGPCLGCGQPR